MVRNGLYLNLQGVARRVESLTAREDFERTASAVRPLAKRGHLEFPKEPAFGVEAIEQLVEPVDEQALPVTALGKNGCGLARLNGLERHHQVFEGASGVRENFFGAAAEGLEPDIGRVLEHAELPFGFPSHAGTSRKPLIIANEARLG